MASFGRTSETDEERAVAYKRWAQQRNPLAIASFVLGLFSFIEIGALVVPGLAGIVLGVVALRQLKKVSAAPTGVPGQPSTFSSSSRSPDHPSISVTPLDYESPKQPPPADAPLRDRGHRLAWAGIILSFLSLLLAAWIYLYPRG